MQHQNQSISLRRVPESSWTRQEVRGSNRGEAGQRLEKAATVSQVGRWATGAPLIRERVQAILRRHRVCYDFWLQGLGPRPGVTTYSGYLLRLCGVNDAEHFGGECHVPSCQSCHRTYDDLREVAEWLIPQNEQGDHCEIEPFDGTLHIVQRQGQSRKEIGVTINALHRHDVNAPADTCQWRCLNDMLAKLDHLGVPEGVLPSRGRGKLSETKLETQR